MGTYIKSTVDRFEKSDSSCFLEIVGCLLWAVLCVRGPELLRVKDLARRSNSFTPEDFQDAMAILHRLNKEPDLGIAFRRGGAEKKTNSFRRTSASARSGSFRSGTLPRWHLRDSQ